MKDAKPAWDRAATLNGLDLRFWGEMPLPLAEIGTRLDTGRADYLDALLALAENAITLAGAMGLAQLSPTQVGSAVQLLTKPSLGSRVELLWQLESAVPGSTGWDPDEPAPEQAALVATVNPGSPTKSPRTRHLFDAITKLRNDKHHGRLAQRHHDDAAALLQDAVFAMIRRNRRFRDRCYYVDSVERAADGSECATADALWGPTMARYRRGHPQKTRMGLRPGRVVQGELEDPRDLHPFLVVRDGRLFVLDELRKGKPIYRHFASRDELANPPSLDGLPQSVAATILDPSVRPRESTPASAAARARLIPGLLLAIVAISSAVALGLFAMQEATSTTSDESPAPSGVVRATLSVDHCPVPARPGLPVEHDLPRLLSGAPAQWGSPASEVERACGSLRPVPFASCAARFVDVRATGWGPTLDIPSRRETQLAFHPTRGLFEVMVWSDADAEALAAAVEQRLGAPHRTERRHRFWSYPVGDDAPTTRLKVSPLPDGHARGRSAIRLHYPPTADAYAADMRAAGCRR